MDKKGYYVEVSFSGKFKILVDAKNEENAKSKVFDTIEGNFESKDKDIIIDEVEWDLIDKTFGGNIKTPFVDDFYIEESIENDDE